MQAIEALKAKQYITPSECALLYGRSASYWRKALDRGLIIGHRNGKEGTRQINRDSVLVYLRNLDEGTPMSVGGSHRSSVSSILRRIRHGQ